LNGLYVFNQFLPMHT